MNNGGSKPKGECELFDQSLSVVKFLENLMAKQALVAAVLPF